MAEYQYEKLSLTTQEIRLLQLQPGDFDDEIRFTIYNASMVKPKLNARPERISLEKLQETVPPGWTAMETLQGRYVFLRDDSNSEHTSWKHPHSSFDHSLYESFNPDLYLDYEPKYEALSYTWGSPDAPEVAVVSSGSPESSAHIMKIGANLALALRYLRYTQKPRTLWVDAISINQGDELERNHQVKFMASIYSMAHQVVIWLGPESTSSDLALATIQSLGKQIEYTRNSWLIRNPSLADTETFYRWNNLPYNEETWSSLHKLIQRPWFARLWIVQEARLANARATVQCGHAKISWTIFARAMVMLDFVGDSPFPDFRMQISTLCDTLFGSSLENISASQLLWAAKNRQCTDPRDRVYGFLGLLPPKFADDIVPQYSLPVTDVYKNAFLVYVDRFKRLDLLSQCVLEGRQIEAPSWVPDWSVSSTISRSPIAYACGMSRAHTSYLSNNVLQVEGAFYGTICSLTLPAPQGIDDALKTVQEWQPEDSELYKSGNRIMSAYLSTLLMGYVKEEFLDYEIPSLNEWRQIYAQHSPGTSGNIDKNLARCDIVFVALGCVTPLILRRDSQQKFQVIGPAYIHDAMHAECFLGPLPEPWVFRSSYDSAGYCIFNYSNPETGIVTKSDPRLDSHPSAWEQSDSQRVPGDPPIFQKFRNKVTGEVMDSDPQMLPGALKARGVQLETVELI